MEEFLIIDGYNVIHAWPELAALMDEDLEHARDRLVDTLADFRPMINKRVIVVFDAHQVKGGLGSQEHKNGIEVIYSQEGETADSAIEKLVASYVRLGSVVVATSDWSEQRFIFGKGASRMSARELIEEVRKFRGNQKESSNLHPLPGDHRLGARIKDEIKVILERIRHQK